MKTIKHLTVTVTYTVGMGDIKVTEKIYNQLCKIAHIEGQLSEHQYPDLHEWLTSNVIEKNAFQWEYNIDELK